MSSRAVHHDACFAYDTVLVSAAGAKPVSRHGNCQFFRFENFVVLWPCHVDGTRIRCCNRTTAHQRVGAAGNLVGGDCRPQSRPGVGADVKAAGKVIEAVVALGYHAHAAIRCKVLILDDGVHIVADIVVAAGSCGGNILAYGHSGPYAHGMDVAVAGCPNLGESRIDRSGLPVIRCHLRFGILIHSVNGNTHSARYLTGDRDIAHSTHGVYFTLGIRHNVDGRMITYITFLCVDARVVQVSPVVFVDVRYGGRALKVEPIFTPAHADTGANSSDAGLLQFTLFIFLAVYRRNGNRTICRSGDVGMVDLRQQLLFFIF